MSFFDIKFGRRNIQHELVETENIMKELNSRRYNNINMERIKKAKKELDAVGGVGLVNINDVDTIKNLFELLAEFFMNTSNRTSRDKMEILLKYSNDALNEIKRGIRFEREKDQLPDSTSSSDSVQVSQASFKSSERLVVSDSKVTEKVATLLVRSNQLNSSYSAKTDNVSIVSHSTQRTTITSKNRHHSNLHGTLSMKPKFENFNKNHQHNRTLMSSSPRFFDVLKQNLRQGNSEENKYTKSAPNGKEIEKIADKMKQPVLYATNSEKINEQQLEDIHISEKDHEKNDISTHLTSEYHEPDKRDATIWHPTEHNDTVVKNDVSNRAADTQNDTQNEMKGSKAQETKGLNYDFNSKAEGNKLNTREREKHSSGSWHRKRQHGNKLKQGNRVQFMFNAENANGKNPTNKSDQMNQNKSSSFLHKDTPRTSANARRTRRQNERSTSHGQSTADHVNVQGDITLTTMYKSKSYMPNQTAGELISVGTQSDDTGVMEEQTSNKRLQSFNGLAEVTDSMDHLRLEVRILKKENEELRRSKEDLLTRLSHKTSEALQKGNPRITNLSDKNRPNILAEHFSELYDNEWTDAYEEMSKTTKQEENVISTLIRIVMFAYQFCDKCAQGQMTNIETFVRKEIMFPNGSKDDVGIESLVTFELDEISYPLKELRKEFGPVSLHKMKPMIMRQIGKNIVSTVSESKKLYLYTERCIELTWLMCIQDPPMYLYQGQARTPHNDIFIPYTRSGPSVEYVVWPCLYLHQGGPLISKGVAQMTNS